MIEPTVKRATVFIDGQNLFFAAKEAFGHSYPNYDVIELSRKLCIANGWQLQKVRFYTGVAEAKHDPKWNGFWMRKFSYMGRQGIEVIPRPLRYHNHRVICPDGKPFVFQSGEEKGIDVRIAVDVIRLAFQKACDVVLLFSQDQDLAEVAEEIRVIASEQDRWIKIVSAYPVSAKTKNPRGVNRTDWIRIDQVLYDACLDPVDFRKSSPEEEESSAY
jgi:uncharacterized LabA/DUF88 family protein